MTGTTTTVWASRNKKTYLNSGFASIAKLPRKKEDCIDSQLHKFLTM